MKDGRGTFHIRPIRAQDRQWVHGLLISHWGSVKIISRGREHSADKLPGFIAALCGRPVGLLTYHIARGACEIVTLDSLREGIGVGSALLHAMVDLARTVKCHRLWLITTNDNTGAIKFYQRRGFSVCAVHHGAVSGARKRKPQIPTHNQEGIPIEHEWELERILEPLTG